MRMAQRRHSSRHTVRLDVFHRLRRPPKGSHPDRLVDVVFVSGVDADDARERALARAYELTTQGGYRVEVIINGRSAYTTWRDSAGRHHCDDNVRRRKYRIEAAMAMAMWRRIMGGDAADKSSRTK